MNRRHFLGALSGATLSAPILAQAAEPAIPPHRLPTRAFGRTGLKVPILGFGCGSRFLMYQQEEGALAALHQAIDLGIRYLDTAHSYGDGRSEERVGKVMVTRRHEVVLATKISARTADGARRQIEGSLRRLRTDRLDVIHIHALKDPADLAAIESRGGPLEALYEARAQGVTRAIGITSHASPVALRTALERHDFDCTQMALNAGLASMTDSMKLQPAAPDTFEALALPVAVRKRMGVIAMKVFGQEHLVGAAPSDLLFRYALSLPVSLASVGMPTPEFVERNAAWAGNFARLSRRERTRLVHSISEGRQHAMVAFFRNHQDA